MKVEFIDENTAILSKGWFNKVSAKVTLQPKDYKNDYWQFDSIQKPVGWALDYYLRREKEKWKTRLEKKELEKAWEPAGKLPKATLVKDAAIEIWR